jgi:hypothetical protein
MMADPKESAGGTMTLMGWGAAAVGLVLAAAVIYGLHEAEGILTWLFAMFIGLGVLCLGLPILADVNAIDWSVAGSSTLVTGFALGAMLLTGFGASTAISMVLTVGFGGCMLFALVNIILTVFTSRDGWLGAGLSTGFGLVMGTMAYLLY